MLISQLMLTPLMILITWGYVRMRPVVACSGGMRIFDIVVILTGICLCILAFGWVRMISVEGNAAVWRPVFSTLATFVIFPMTLFLGWWLRNRLFRA